MTLYVVYPGTYYETIDFAGKAITLTSTDPNDWAVVDSTVIDANGSGVTVMFETSEDANSVLTGFTVTGASSWGVECDGASPTISNCARTSNVGRGISLFGSSAFIDACKIHNNTTVGIFSIHESPTITNCLIFEQDAGIELAFGTSPIIRNTTIADNASYGIMGGTSSVNPTITNCIIWGNTDDLKDDYTATYSCIEDGDAGTGNISSNPDFIDAANDDYHLDSGSPCIDAGDNTATTDTGNGTAPIVDMGADEYDPN